MFLKLGTVRIQKSSAETIVDFYANWCGPRRQLAPNLEQMTVSDPEVAVRKIDVAN